MQGRKQSEMSICKKRECQCCKYWHNKKRTVCLVWLHRATIPSQQQRCQNRSTVFSMLLSSCRLSSHLPRTLKHTPSPHLTEFTIVIMGPFQWLYASVWSDSPVWTRVESTQRQKVGRKTRVSAFFPLVALAQSKAAVSPPPIHDPLNWFPMPMVNWYPVKNGSY